MNNAAYYFCVGLGIGVGMAMLMAPRPGKDTRDLIRDKAADGAEYLKQSGVELRDKAAEFARKPTEAIVQQKAGVVAALRAGKRAYAKAVGA